MRILAAWLMIIAALTQPLSAQSIAPGMPEAELLKLKGAPESKATLGKKSIYRWPDAQVTLVDGKVESFRARNASAEKADAREKARAEAQRKAEAAAKARDAVLDAREATVHTRLDTAATTREKEQRLLRAAYISQEIRSIEQQLSDDAKRNSFSGPKPLSAEARAYLNLRLENLRTELATLR